jgi:hypothetical protein
MKATLILISTFFFSLSLLADVPYKSQESDHIKEIFTSWDATKGEWLYASLNALVMNTEFPERPAGVVETPSELISTMGDTRKNRVLEASNTALENERNSAKRNQREFYWTTWREYFSRASCSMSQGRSNGDPHMKTFDGEKYDFQTAGEYELVNSEFSRMNIQTRQVRYNSKVSINAAAVLNVNGDIVSIYAQDFPDEKTNKPIRINGEVLEDDRKAIFLKNGGVIRYNKDRHVINWPSGEQMHVKSRTFSGSSLLDIDVFVPTCALNTYTGLLSDVTRTPEFNVPSQAGARAGVFNRNQEFNAVFGPGRHETANQTRERNFLQFMAEDFGERYAVGTDRSMFEMPMGPVPPELKFPETYITLSDLTDEQIEEALAECRAAGVAEEDLMDCVYDKGYVGLAPDLPAVYDNTYAVVPERKEPSQTNGERAKPANNTTNPTVFPPRRRSTIFRGGSTTTPSAPTPRGGTTKSPTPTPRTPR